MVLLLPGRRVGLGLQVPGASVKARGLGGDYWYD